MPSLKPLINFHKKKYTRGLGITVSAQRGHFILGKFFTGFTESRQQTDTLLTAVSSWLFIWGDDVVWERPGNHWLHWNLFCFFSFFSHHSYLWGASPSPVCDSGLIQDGRGEGKSVDLWPSQKWRFPIWGRLMRSTSAPLLDLHLRWTVSQTGPDKVTADSRGEERPSLSQISSNKDRLWSRAGHFWAAVPCHVCCHV